MIKILHGADLHLDSPFSGCSPEEAVRRRSLQRRLPMALTTMANGLDCRLMLLAGDIFDGTPSPRTVQALQEAFRAFRGRVFIAPGNHDPYTEDSVWATRSWPDNVHIFQGAAEAVILPELGCRVWGGGFGQTHCRDGLPRVTSDGLVEIGVFHGDPETDSPYRPISRQEIADCGLDYLALGHIHKRSMPRKFGATWYGWPGVTQGRGFDETGLCGVFCTELDKTRCNTAFLPVEGLRYEILYLPAGTDPESVIPSDSEHVIACVIRTGEDDGTPLPDLKERFYAVEIRDETVPVRDVWADCGSQTLKGLTLTRLKAVYDEAKTESDRQRAHLAAQYVLAALEGRDAP